MKNGKSCGNDIRKRKVEFKKKENANKNIQN